MNNRPWFALFVLLPMLALASDQESVPPIIDMHLHAYPADRFGPPPVAICAPFRIFPTWNTASQGQSVMAAAGKPYCDRPLHSPATDDALRQETVRILERHNIVGVISGKPGDVRAWRESAPDRLIPGLELFGPGVDVSPDDVRRLHADGELKVLAEVVGQYAGIGPKDPKMAPFWALAEELDLPVGIHIHPGPPGISYLGGATQGLTNPLDLEDILIEYPKLRIYVIHAGWPQLDDMLTLMYTHPQVHVDIGALVNIHPRPDFYRYLEAIIDAGFGKRVMFSSDQMIWPELIERAIESIEQAPFLNEEQRRDIFYNNAARFLRLGDDWTRYREESSSVRSFLPDLTDWGGNFLSQSWDGQRTHQ